MREVELLKNGDIKVNTPVPYIIDSYRDADITKRADIMYDLKQNVRFLRDCLRLLGISNKEAREKEYTLNIMTGDKLMGIATHNKNISNEFYKCCFIDHKW